MGAPKYDNSNYEAAEKEYKELQKEYTGEEAYDKAQTKSVQDAKETAQTVSSNAGSLAGANAQAAARSAGMSRSKAIATGAQTAANAAANAYGNTYNNAYNNNLSNRLTSNKNTLDTQDKLTEYAKGQDDAKFNSELDVYSEGLGAATKTLEAAGKIFTSDKNLKNISEKTSKDRCNELLNRLTGGKSGNK